MWIKIKLEPYNWFYVFTIANAFPEGSFQPRQKLTSAWCSNCLPGLQVFTVTQWWLSQLLFQRSANDSCQQPLKSTVQHHAALQREWNPRLSGPERDVLSQRPSQAGACLPVSPLPSLTPGSGLPLSRSNMKVLNNPLMTPICLPVLSTQQFPKHCDLYFICISQQPPWRGRTK